MKTFIVVIMLFFVPDLMARPYNKPECIDDYIHGAQTEKVAQNIVKLCGKLFTTDGSYSDTINCFLENADRIRIDRLIENFLGVCFMEHSSDAQINKVLFDGTGSSKDIDKAQDLSDCVRDLIDVKTNVAFEHELEKCKKKYELKLEKELFK